MRWVVVLPVLAACSFHPPSASSGDDASDPDPDPDAGAGSDSGGSARWWNPAWSSRMQIIVDNPAALAQGYQLGIPYNLDASPCGAARDAFRVVRDHTTELPRVIDEGEGAGDEWIWFRLPAALAASAGPTEYWLYCEHAAPPSAPSDPADVFDAHEDFNGSTLPSAWRALNTVTVAGGAVTLPNGTSIRSNTAYGAGTAVDFILQPSASSLSTPWFWGGFEIEFNVTPPWVIWHSKDTAVIWQESQRAGSPNPVTAGLRQLDTAPHLYGVEHHGTSATFRYGNADVGTIQYGGAIQQSMNVRFHNYTSTGPIQIHMARVRKAVTPLPRATLGALEKRT